MSTSRIEPGTLIKERYRIVRLLGQGGMGSVYAAADQHLGLQVALKVLRPDVAADVAARQRFMRESKIAAQLTHPNIVRTYDTGDSPHGPYLVQELLTGHTLEQEIPLSSQRALRVALAVAEALAYIHARGYVHGDIKPANIMLAQQEGAERIVLLDFGIARTQGAATTTFLATPQYLAPERVQGAAPTPASDLYALGIVLYYLLAGRLPFDATMVQTILTQHVLAPLPPLAINAPNAPMLEAVVRKLTEKQPPSALRLGCRPADRPACRVEQHVPNTTTP